MSNRYKGGVISATPPTTTGGEEGAASGAWTLEQQAQLQAAGLWPAQPTGPYIEQVFSTYLYTGNGSTQTITNGIDLSGQGGLTWLKRRDATSNHNLFDTVRGATKKLYSDLTNAEYTDATSLTSFNSNGFSLGLDGGGNANGGTYASWTFRKQAKFFDVVTWTGDDSANRQISHSLGSVPGCIIVKRTDASATWRVWHQNMVSNPANLYQYQLNLNTTDAVNLTYGEVWGTSNNVTSTTFQIGSLAAVNASGGTFVAYVFAHNAGGFGLTGTDNVISCGSFTTGNGGKISAPVNLGYEAQWLLAKNVDSAENWVMYDIMRGMNNTGYAALNPNTSGAEYTGTSAISPTATGFDTPNASGPFASFANYIYIAIRRGPMRVPTSGTSVYNADTTITATTPAAVSGFVTDLMISTNRTNKATYNQMFWSNRLTGDGYTSSTNTTAEQSGGAFGAWDTMNGSGTSALQSAGVSDMAWMFKRAPGFFDEVCYTGTGSATTVTHNLGVAPELIIIKKRSNTSDWAVLQTGVQKQLYLNGNSAGDVVNATYFGNDSVYVAPTSTVFSLGSSSGVNGVSGQTFVAYLFATCAGVSKVGSYTGTGTTQQINCGFTGGSRFVLIKRTDSTGDWYVWDSARGIVAGNDPYLLLNSTAAEVTNTDYVDTYSAGFEISSTAPAAINANGGTFIFLAIA